MGRAGDLERIAKLRDQGVLTQEEFELEKNRILGYTNDQSSPKKSGAAALFITLFLLFIVIGIGAAFLAKNILEKHKIPDDIKTTEITAQTRPDARANQREEEKEPNRKAPSIRDQYLNQEQNEPVFSDLPQSAPDDASQEKNAQEDIIDGTRGISDTEEVKAPPEENPVEEPIPVKSGASTEKKPAPPSKTPEAKKTKEISSALPASQTLTAGSYTAGTDLPPGVYNIEAVSGSGTFQAGEITDGGYISTISSEPGKDGTSTKSSAQNITIKPQDKVIIMNNLSVKVTKTGNLPAETTSRE